MSPRSPQLCHFHWPFLVLGPATQSLQTHEIFLWLLGICKYKKKKKCNPPVIIRGMHNGHCMKWFPALSFISVVVTICIFTAYFIKGNIFLLSQCCVRLLRARTTTLFVTTGKSKYELT